MIDNGVATGGVSLSNLFEVATDAGFATVVVTKNVLQSTSGQTALMLDPLRPGTYYWRVRTAARDEAVTSPIFSFSVALPVPVSVSPEDKVLIGHLNQPITLVVQYPVLSPPLGIVTNNFDVATDAAFANVVVSRSGPQTASGLTTLALEPLPPNVTYYWRVRVAATGLVGAVSATASFKIGPAIVSGPYRLRVAPSIAPSCRFQEFFFDGYLTVVPQTWVFTLAPNPPYRNDLALRLQLEADCFLRGGVCLSGSLVSNESFGTSSGFDAPARVLISKAAVNPGQAMPVDVGGVVDPAALVHGAFTGYLRVDSPAPCRYCFIPNANTFPVFGCTDLLGWSLLPR
jgi:hypothetical protein